MYTCISKKIIICIFFFFSVSLQGFTAAQLSTESVSKLLSEEPSAQAGADLEYQLLEAAKAGKKILEPRDFLKQKRFKKVAWIQSHYLHLQ